MINNTCTLAAAELSRIIPMLSTEGELADAYAAVSNRFMALEDDDSSFDGAVCRRARRTADIWGGVMEQLESRVSELTLCGSAGISSGRLNSFMARNGYSARTGCWVKTA